MEKISKELIVGVLILLIVALVTYLVKFIRKQFHKKKIYNYLQKNTADEIGKKFKSTNEISNSCNLSTDRVIYICENHKKIDRSSEIEENWSIYGPDEGSIYDDRGVVSV